MCSHVIAATLDNYTHGSITLGGQERPVVKALADDSHLILHNCARLTD